MEGTVHPIELEAVDQGTVLTAGQGPDVERVVRLGQRVEGVPPLSHAADRDRLLVRAADRTDKPPLMGTASAREFGFEEARVE